MPFQSLRLGVLPGQIHCNERIYSQICDHGNLAMPISLDPPSSFIKNVGLKPILELLVEETASSNQLKAMFCTQRQKLSTDYLGYLSAFEKVGDERWEDPNSPPEFLSIRPGTLWHNIILRLSSPRNIHCHRKNVEVSLTQSTALGSSFTSLTGDCSMLKASEDTQ